MNAFQLREYWRYRRAAMGRHGIHSPAVYRFVEEALRPADKHFSNALAFRSQHGAIWPADMLMRRIAHHFHFREIIAPAAGDEPGHVFHSSETVEHQNFQPLERLYDWRGLAPEDWVPVFMQGEAYWSPREVIAVSGIHNSPSHLRAWQNLTDQHRVRLSLDLFRIGLLFFSEDFKERQHFVLRYPL